MRNPSQRQRDFKDFVGDLARDYAGQRGLGYIYWLKDVQMLPSGEQVTNYSIIAKANTGAQVKIPFTPQMMALVEDARNWVEKGKGEEPCKIIEMPPLESAAPSVSVGPVRGR